MKRASAAAVLALAVLAVSACSSRGGGFSCPYQDQGFGCHSTPAVYDMTNAGFASQLAVADTPARTGSRTQVRSPRPSNTHAAAVQGNSLSLAAPVQEGLGAFHSSALSLSGPAPAPMPSDANAVARMPAQVMRIWVSPWVDEAGDLHQPGHIYTEIVSRRWAVGGDIRESDGHISFDPNGAMYPTN